MRKDCTQVINIKTVEPIVMALQIHRVSPLGSIHVVEPTLFTQQHILYIFNILVAPYLTALHEL